jgi:osmoprotectant transport system permease protein
VLALLVATGIAAAFGLAFLSHAPNRLVSGAGVSLGAVLGAAPGVLTAALMLTAAVLVAAVFIRASARSQALVVLASAVLFALLAALAGKHAATLAASSTPYARTLLGAGFWVLALLCVLAFADALVTARLPSWVQALAWATAAAPLAALFAGGVLDDVSLVKEYMNRRDVFGEAVLRHLQIVAASLAATLLVGVPLGAALYRHERVSRPVFAVLNVLQTVPSIALFGLLMAPLAALAAALPALARLGVSGVGLAPAVVALTSYSLLPIVRSIDAGLRQVPAAALEAATGLGFTPRQCFWRVAVPLAWPSLWAGLRVCTVQAIGLAVVAALIGAGGLGAIVFQGLLGSALDLVLLGVLPVVALAVLADAAFSVVAGLMQWAEPSARPGALQGVSSGPQR